MTTTSKIINEIRRIIAEIIISEDEKNEFKFWQEPIIGFASTEDVIFVKLRQWTSQEHLMPEDILVNAATVVVYFIPYRKEVGKSNNKGRNASQIWGEAYIKTNSLSSKIKPEMKALFEGKGFKCEFTPATHNFTPEKLISNWSHRHLAYIAGIGTLGKNNMLITQKGCSGRLESFITDCRLEPTKRPEQDFCLSKLNYTCDKCLKRCVNDSLSKSGFDRFRCYEMCLENDAHLSNIGLSDVCGKCLIGIPCAWANPSQKVRTNRSGG
ncbi:MAG: epoxyqueuosine reductase [Calditrichaeota bacterium]|jgi:epoxyqueuosine reductase QueG|nr:epoxyqueuosine reductase [Calditrichota bacterium]